MKLTYSRRLFLLLLTYSLLLAGCFLAFQYKREKEFKAAELDSELHLINTLILNELSDSIPLADIRLSGLEPFTDLRVSVISPSGELIYDNSLDSLPHTNHLHRSEIARAITDGHGYTVRRHSESTGNTYFYSATRGADGTVVRTAVPYSLPLKEFLEADFNFLWVMGMIAFVMCVAGYIVTRRIGLHVARLGRFAQSVERGERISDTDPFPHDELGDISNHLVRLYSRLQQANAARLREHRAALFEQQEKERIKKQLTNNINHELKTPVASIQACLETLADHPNLSPERRIDFINRSLANAHRLKRLLDDVSLITRMDDGGEAIIRRRLDLHSIIAECVAEHEPIAAAKGITIVNRIDESIEFTGNDSLLGSIFRNLISNAIAYSGGSLITLTRIATTADKLTIILADNGSGVPTEQLPHLFERFYRIDTGRSRAAGGTGLGLSIVKNAVIFHHGNIKVDNATPHGLRFTITLPLDPTEE